VSGALGVLAKIGFFLLVVVVGLFVFRKDTRREVSDRWAMRKCPELIEADIRLLMPWSDPKVTQCQGTPARATCSVETTEHGGRKTAPVKEWDCSKRHISENFYRDFMKAAMQAPAPGQTPEEQSRAGREMLDRTLTVKEDFIEAIRYVSQKLRDRYTELGESGTWPSGLGFPFR
jgi:hypothetical protein